MVDRVHTYHPSTAVARVWLARGLEHKKRDTANNNILGSPEACATPPVSKTELNPPWTTQHTRPRDA